MNISTDRLILRTFIKSDISETYINWLKDPLVTRFSNQRFIMHDKALCENYLESFSNTSNSFLLIEKISDKNAIGTATIYRNSHHGTADIGLLIGARNEWGKGYGFESWQAILTSIYLDSKIRKVTAGTTSCNYAMIKIIEKSGMELEATRYKQELVGRQAVDLLYYAKFK